MSDCLVTGLKKVICYAYIIKSVSSTVEINSIWQKEILRKICFGITEGIFSFYC